jgi:hypothetical protein
MAVKPLSSTLPRWADTVAGDPTKVSEPAAGKKDMGWLVAEKPPAQWKNWLLLQTYNWLVWLDAFETEAHSWTKTQTFGAGITVSNTTLNTRAILGTGNGTAEGVKGIGGPGGHGVLGEASGAGTYGVYGKGTALGVIAIRGEGGTDSAGGSFVGGGIGAGVVATGGAGGAVGISGLGVLAYSGVYGQGGATGKGGEFYGGSGGSPNGIYCKGGAPDGHGIKAEATGTGYAVECLGTIHTDLHVFADQTVAAGTGGSVNTMHSSYSEFTTPTHAVAGSSIKHRIAPCNTPRVLATITTDGAGGLTVQDDQGVGGAAIVGGNKIQVTFVDAMSVAGKYQAVVSGYDTGTGGGNFAIIQADKNTGYVRVLCPSNPSTNVMNFDLVVTGRQ